VASAERRAATGLNAGKNTARRQACRHLSATPPGSDGISHFGTGGGAPSALATG